jgi:hypothetical protein
MLTFFQRIRAWLFYLNVWEVAGILANHQLFAALESLALLLVLVLLAFLLPSKWLTDRFVSLGGALALLTAGVAVAAHLTKTVPFTLQAQGQPVKTALVWALYLVLLALSVALIHRFERIEKLVRSLVTRTTILGLFYALLTGASLIVFVIRVLSGNR